MAHLSLLNLCTQALHPSKLVGQTLCRVAACFMKISIFGSSASEEEGMRYIVVSTLCPTRSSGYVLFYNYTDVSDEAVMV